jgi:hypothetical protein
MYKPPVAFLVFNRPDCTRQVFEEIRRFKPTQLLIVADGPRPSVPTDVDRCEAVRKIVADIDWACEVQHNFAEHNLGCKVRVSSGLDWAFSVVEEAIILEDDCLPSEDFFRFCSELLPRYRTESKVMHISGDNFQDGRIRGNGSYYFSRYTHVWGWASWRRAWQHYDVSMSSWPEARQRGWLRELGLDRVEREYWTGIFERAHAGGIDTWDYQWLYTCWRERGVAIQPNVNLVTNIGASPDATHTKEVSPLIGIPHGSLSRIVHRKRVRADGKADRYSFEVCYGGAALRRERSLLHRIKRRTWDQLSRK